MIRQNPRDHRIILGIDHDPVHNLKSGLLPHGLDFTDNLADEAFLNQLRRQIGIQNHRHILVRF